MKSFSFSLSSVLKYKNQVLNNLVIEYGEIANQVNKKREEISKIDEHLKSVDTNFKHKKSDYFYPQEAIAYENYLDSVNSKKENEIQKLKYLKNKEENKKNEVIEAKLESSSIDKLKERRFKEYQYGVDKSTEQMIEEFIRTQDYLKNKNNYW